MEVSLNTAWQASFPSEQLSSASSTWGDSSSTTSVLNNYPKTSGLSSTTNSDYEQPYSYMSTTNLSPSGSIDASNPTSTISSSSVTSSTTLAPWWSTVSSDPKPLKSTADTKSSYLSFSSSSPWWESTSNDIYASPTTSSSNLNTQTSSNSIWSENSDSIWGLNPILISGSSSGSITVDTSSNTFINSDTNSNFNWWLSTTSSSYEFMSSTGSMWASTFSSPSTWTTSDDFQNSLSSTSLPWSSSSLVTTSSDEILGNMEPITSLSDSYSWWNPSTTEFYSPSGYTTSKSASPTPSTSPVTSQMDTSPVALPSQSSYNWGSELSIAAISSTITLPSQSSYNWNSELSTTSTTSTSPTFAWLSGWYSSWFLSSSPTMLPSASEAPAIMATMSASSNVLSSYIPQTSTSYDPFTTATPTPTSSISQPLISSSTFSSRVFTILSSGSPSSSTIPTYLISSASSASSLINTIDPSSSTSDLWIYSSSEPQPITSSVPATEDLRSTDTAVPAGWSDTILSGSTPPSPITALWSYVGPSNSIIPTTTSDFPSATSLATNDSSDIIPTSNDEPVSSADDLSNYLPTISGVEPTTSVISSPVAAPTSLSSDPVATIPTVLFSTTSSSSSDWYESTPMTSGIESSQVVAFSSVPSDSSATSSIWFELTPPTSSDSSFFVPSSSSLFPISMTYSWTSPVVESSSQSPISSSSSTTSAEGNTFSKTSSGSSSNHSSKSGISSPSYLHFSSQSNSTSSTNADYSVSYGTRSAYYIYTQTYVITASTTTFETGIPTTVGMPRSGSSTFSTPQPAVTQDIGFYNYHLNKDNHHNSRRGGNDTGAIVGGVVGGVCGVVGCCLATWILLRRRRNHKRSAESPQGFSEEIGNRVENTSPSETPRTYFQEKPEEYIASNTGNNENQLFSIFRTKRISRTPGVDLARNQFFDPNFPCSSETKGIEDPFRDKYNSRGRSHGQVQVTPPRVPPPRKMHSNTQHPIPSKNINSSRDNRSSLVSSLNDSSFASSLQGDYSTLSSGPIRLDPSVNGSNIPENPEGGFFLEVI
ncbi:hypothetical protein ZYGR_0I04000 [Zygosaccharomyces rouxii]|uniref:Uncharacterized protein n=1 Tax=Zygosaccharomyces rouxii TaxID=4956 RepID=A0A1Q2ZXU0_ZYGRO|nr:hypothetical protein ZYGR_0I04000 [Zygosaccharomyces rouxii]